MYKNLQDFTYLFIAVICFVLCGYQKGYSQTPDVNGIVYVKQGGAGNKNGSSWTNATDNLQAAIDATGVQEVWVAAGTYMAASSGIAESLPGFRTREGFVMKNNVAIYGGFPATGTPAMANRDWRVNATILSGNQQLRVISNIFTSGNKLTSSALLDGFTITKGKSPDYEYGGGMYNVYASPTLNNLIISNSVASWDGGGMYNDDHSAPILSNVTISGNTAKRGGGMCNYKNSSPTLINVIISNNIASSGAEAGAGMYNENSSPTLNNVVINGNKATSGEGGGMYNIYESPKLINVTISGNMAKFGGGIFNSYYSKPQIYNSIIWGNKKVNGVTIDNIFNEDIPIDNSNKPIYAFSLVEGSGGSNSWNIAFGINNGNNIDANPKFTDTTDGTYTLKDDSPAINKGSNTLYPNLNANTKDIQGNERVHNYSTGGTIDMGAFESPYGFKPTYTYNQNITKTYGDDSFEPEINSSSDGAFIYVSDNTDVAVIADNKITIRGAGTATITAIQAAIANYNEGSIDLTLTVEKANPALSGFANISKTYGEADFTLIASISNSDGAFSYSSSDENIATISGNTVTIVGAGTATITATQSATDNYNSGSIALTLTVDRANPVLSGFADINKVYGDADFTLTAPTSNSNGTFSYTSSNEDVATISGNTVTIVGAGTATITATQLATDNYNSGSIALILTVDKANPVLSGFANINKTYGDADFILTAPTSNSSGAFSYTSSNEDVATISGNTVTIVGAGTATITATQLATANYNSGSIDLTLTVDKANPVLSAFADISKTYGDNSFTLTAPASNSSGVFVYISSDENVATVAGSTVTIIGAGTATITATQGETANYNSGNIDLTLTVEKANPVLSAFADISKTYGDNSFTLTAPASNSNGAFSYTSSNGNVATVSGSMVTIVGSGTATITARQAETANYNSSNIDLILTVDKANPALSGFANINKFLTDDDFILVPPTSNSNGAFTYSSSNPDVATIHDNTININGVGIAAINAVQASTENYNSGTISLILTVTEKTLSVSLLSFIAKVENNRAKLEWSSAGEQNNREFIVYRSGDNQEFVRLGAVSGAGNSTTIHNYVYFDGMPLPGNNYYKLVQVDLNDKTTELDTKMLNFGLPASDFRLYPNPTINEVNVSFEEGIYRQLFVSDVNGRILQTLPIGISEKKKNVSLYNYPAGSYFIQIRGDKRSETGKILKF